MYQTGQGQGQTYVAPEGNGFSAIVGTPKSDQAGLWIAQKKAAEVEKQAASTKLERQKALGLLDNVKMDVFQPHFQEVQKELGGFMDKVANDMITLNNPFDLRDPKGAENLKKLNAIKSKIALSKNMQNEFDMLERGDHSSTDPKSLDDVRNWYKSSTLEDLINGKSEKPKLVPKNPYGTQEAIFKGYINDLEAKRAKDGTDLADDTQAVQTMVGDVLQNDKNAQQFYQTYFDSMPKEQQKAYEDKTMKMNEQGKKVNKFEVMALDHLDKTLSRTPFNKTNVADVLAKKINYETKSESGDVTIMTKNQGSEFEKRLDQTVKNFMLDDSPDATRARRSYGITKEDITNGTEQGKKAIADFRGTVKPLVDTKFSRSEDELKKWQIDLAKKAAKEGTDSPDQVLADLFSSGENELQQQAAQHFIGRNSSIGGVIDDAQVSKDENGNYGLQISYTADDPDSNGRRTQQSKFIKGTAENNGRLKDLIEGANKGQKKEYKRVIGNTPVLDKVLDKTIQVKPTQNNDWKSW